ncbi:MAG: flavin reductase family protein [Actinomycetota bacterium]|nr:flavin reductase family protein [Actinomycetota bacterium]
MGFADFTRLVDPPLYVLTVAGAHENSGCLIGFASQVSIFPPRFLACVSEVNHTAKLTADAEVLALHLLGADQKALAAHFGELTGDEVDKFAGVAWHPGPFGAPILEAARAVFEGRVLERHRFGDHVGHLLEPLDASASAAQSPGEQLRLNDAVDLDAGHPPEEALDHPAGGSRGAR